MSLFVLSAGCTREEISLLREVAGSDSETPLVYALDDLMRAHMWASLHRPDITIVNTTRGRHHALEFVRRFRTDPTCTDIPLLAIVDGRRREDRADVILAGATDVIAAPLDPYECQVRVLNLLTLGAQRRLLRDYERRAVRAPDTLDRQREWAREMLLRFARAGSLRSEEAAEQIVRIGRISRAIATRLELPHAQRDIIEIAAPMRDIGKIGVPDAILRKSGPLTEEEHEQMQAHTLIGYELLRDSTSPYLQCGAEIALTHHEKYDGSGYPYGIRGAHIPLAARIAAVADVYDALSGGRAHEESWGAERVVAYLDAERGRHFDPRCVDALLEELDQAAGF